MTHWKAGLVLTLSAACGMVHAERIFLHGFEESCFVDTDGDRLVDCEEANRNTAVDNPDTDNDGLSDGDEVLGTLGGLDLPAFGVDPRHKDLLVEMDWDEDARNCGQHSHRPAASTIEEVKIFYAAIPLANPDGEPGVNFIADFGQGGAFSGGNLLEVPNGVRPSGTALRRHQVAALRREPRGLLPLPDARPLLGRFQEQQRTCEHFWR